MPVSRNAEEAERDIAREAADIEARGFAVMGSCVSVREDGSVSWVLCPGEPLPELTPEEAGAARARLVQLAESLPPWTPQLPDWRPGDKPTGRDPEAVRLVAERKRREQEAAQG